MIAIDKHDHGVCFCLRRHDNMGYAPTFKHPVRRFCEACLKECGADGIKRLYHMNGKRMDAYEDKALEAGSDQAGEYLDSIGKTDLATLERHEWLEMWRVGLVGYADKMRSMAADGAAPF